VPLLFIAEIGVSVDLVGLLSDGPAVLLFGTIAIVVHIVLLLAVGGWLRFSLKEICIASNACIGGHHGCADGTELRHEARRHPSNPDWSVRLYDRYVRGFWL
jgi:hypothetical protein